MNKKNPAEKIQYWVAPDLHNLEMLSASYSTHSFARHTHDRYAIGVIEQGALTFSYRKQKWVASAGQINLVIPGEAHNGAAADKNGWSYRMFYLEPEWLAQVAAEMAGRETGLPFFAPGVIIDNELAKQIRKLHMAMEENRIPLMERESRLLKILGLFIHKYSDRRLTLREPGQENGAVKQVREYIEAKYAENVSLQELASLCNLSPYHLIRVFEKSVGVPPHIYLKQVRVRHAREWLTQGYSAAFSAQEAGFADQSHLSRQFRRIIGMAPGQYRNFVQALSIPRNTMN